VTVFGVPGWLEGPTLQARYPIVRRILGRIILSLPRGLIERIRRFVYPRHGLVLKISSQVIPLHLLPRQTNTSTNSIWGSLSAYWDQSTYFGEAVSFPDIN
jgi:hypothetical protein